MTSRFALAALFMFSSQAFLRAADCQVALKYLSLEAAGNLREANNLILLPAEWNQFRDRPAYVIDKKPDSLTQTEYQTIQALGALVRFDLVGCDAGLVRTVATIRYVRPDFLRLFPNRTEGVVIRTPKDGAEREQWIGLLQSRLGDLSKIPMVTETYPIPIVDSGSGPKVGLSRF